MDRLRKIGKIKMLSAFEVKDSRLGIGFEKLDRALFDPEKAYDAPKRPPAFMTFPGWMILWIISSAGRSPRGSQSAGATRPVVRGRPSGLAAWVVRRTPKGRWSCGSTMCVR